MRDPHFLRWNRPWCVVAAELHLNKLFFKTGFNYMVYQLPCVFILRPDFPFSSLHFSFTFAKFVILPSNVSSVFNLSLISMYLYLFYFQSLDTHVILLLRIFLDRKRERERGKTVEIKTKLSQNFDKSAGKKSLYF